MRRYQPRVFHADTTVGQKKFPAEIVDLEPALLACGKPADLGADSAAVDVKLSITASMSRMSISEKSIP